MKHPFLFLLLLIGRVCFGQLTVQGPDGKVTVFPEGKYTLIVGKPQAEETKPEAEKPPVVTLPNCGCGKPDFEILSITKKEGSNYEVKFDACNVTPLSWQVGIKAGTFAPTSAKFTVDLSGLSAGEYDFIITSTGCSGKAQKKFSIASGNTDPPTIPTDRPARFNDIQFIENGTGNSVDFNAENGISNNFPEQFRKFAENGVDVIRLVFQVGSYHPSAGIFKNSKLTDAIKWVRALPGSPKVDILLVPVFSMGDNRFPDNELYRDSQGHKADCTFALNTFPSYYSPTAKKILNEAYESLIPYLVSKHSEDINDLSFAGGTSEEHYMPHTANYPGGPGCGGGYGGIGDYSQSARDSWRSWLMDKYGPLAQVPYQINGQTYKTYNASLPFVGVSSGNNYNLDFNNPAHRDVTRFWNQGVLDVWKHFRDKVKQHSNFPVEYFVADMFNEQGIRWLFNAGTMHKAMELCDVWYHTYNHSPGDWGHNLVGTDVLHGTFGTGKASAIEYDSFDAGAGGSGGWINTEHLKKSIVKFLEGGGKKIHWAMNWNANQINQIGEVIRWVKDNYINNPNWIPAYIKARPTAPTVILNTHDMFYNSAYIDKAWQSTGNSLNSPFSANIINIQVVDTFWTIPKP